MLTKLFVFYVVVICKILSLVIVIDPIIGTSLFFIFHDILLHACRNPSCDILMGIIAADVLETVVPLLGAGSAHHYATDLDQRSLADQ